MQIIVHGATGRMGRNLRQLIGQNPAHTLAAAVSPQLETNPEKLEFGRLEDFSGPAEILIDFSHHTAVGTLLDYARRRRDKQPLEWPSAGSTFKRPEGYFAGKLIEDAGLRGYRIGGACVSEKHCGFIVNDQGATSAQIRALIEHVQDVVWKHSGVMLEPEVLFVGEF